jgi:hypothetical protein
MEPKYGLQFTAFVAFLGFIEVSAQGSENQSTGDSV